MESKTPAQEVREFFQEITHMEVDPSLGKRETEAPDTAGPQDRPVKFPRPTTKGQGQGKGNLPPAPTSAGSSDQPDPAPQDSERSDLARTEVLNSLNSTAESLRGSRKEETNKSSSHQRGWGQNRQGSGQGYWKGWSNQRTSSYQHWPQGDRHNHQATETMEENIKLLARVCLRHEDELSQMRSERDFILTFETRFGTVLQKLYQIALVWKEKKETNQVDCSLRQALFIAVLQMWHERLRSVRLSQGYAAIPEGKTELQWFYLKWNSEKGLLEKVEDAEPLLQSQVLTSLVHLQDTITAPHVLQRFHSTRRMAEKYQGETVTFLLSVGLRDPRASQSWGMLSTLCGCSASKVLGLRIRESRMDRQPLLKVLAERFPPTSTSSQPRTSQRRSPVAPPRPGPGGPLQGGRQAEGDCDGGPIRLGVPVGFLLRNSTNVCYMNSWCHLQHAMGSGLTDELAHGRLSTAMRILRK